MDLDRASRAIGIDQTKSGIGIALSIKMISESGAMIDPIKDADSEGRRAPECYWAVPFMVDMGARETSAELSHDFLIWDFTL